MNEYNQSNNTIISTLIYIISFEIFKGSDRINTDTINKCTHFIQELDNTYVVPEEKKETLKEKLHDEYHRIYDCNVSESQGKHHIKLRKKLRITIIAAVVAILFAGLTVYAFTDWFSLFFNEPKDILTWKNGESRRIGNIEMTVNDGPEYYNSVEELITSKSVDIVLPKDLPKEYSMNSILSYQHKNTYIAEITYLHNGYEIKYIVTFSYDKEYEKLLSSSEYKHIIAGNNTIFYLMNSEIAFQADSFINGFLYTVTAENENEIFLLLSYLKE
ncbi:MAG: hypothetical protein PUB34_00870 [Clostridia bacterium]|nr:hypothetical protein [Clostridia bacterium]